MTLLIIGEAWGKEEHTAKRPFVGASGKLLRSALRTTGIADYKLTNVFNCHPPGNILATFLASAGQYQVQSTPRRFVAPHLEHEIERLFSEIAEADRLLLLGGTALGVCAEVFNLTASRGTPLQARGKEAIATWHPAAVLRQYSLLYDFYSDLLKANRPWVRRKRRLLVPETVQDLASLEEEFSQYSLLACDIETKQSQITEVGFAASPELACTIPFWSATGNYWPTANLEKQAWRLVNTLCQKPLVGQNFSYDMTYLWKQAKIRCPNYQDDTMILHNCHNPEALKSLRYLASIYTDEPSWKADRETDSKEL